MSDGTMTMDEKNARAGFCPNCDAPIYPGETGCIYCNGADAHDFHAVAVISLLVILALGLAWLLLA